MSAEPLSPAAGQITPQDPAPPSSSRRWSPLGRGTPNSIQPPEPPQLPPRRPRRGGFLSRISALFTLLVFVFAVGALGIVYGQGLFNGAGPLSQDKIVVIPRGSGTSEIATILEQEGVISSALMFEISNIFSTGSLKFGEYQFKQNASLKEVRDTLVEGRSIQHSITIPEGLTSEQIVNRIKENEILEGEVRTIPREGVLLPDTYRFGRGFSRSQLLARMEAEQKKALAEIWARRSPDLPLKQAADLVILASIVEKETGRADERTRVAGLFVNRLNRGMRLESDPTIIYGIVGGKGSLGRGILATEIRAPTPYNTYVINGLPPGPIANPGRAALEATANPSKTRDIFFVADGTGGHAFAETLEQHNRNVARWRQIERGEAPAAPPSQLAPQIAPPRPRTDLAPQVVPQLNDRMLAAAPPKTPDFYVPEAPLGLLVPGGGGLTREQQAEQDRLTLERGGEVESYPVSPGRRQAMQRGANQVGVGSGAVIGPGMQGQDYQNNVSAMAPAEAAPAPRRPRAFDASEGTAKDPLKNKSFDLNSPKTIPQLR
jgi:UPF0755 protein